MTARFTATGKSATERKTGRPRSSLSDRPTGNTPPSRPNVNRLLTMRRARFPGFDDTPTTATPFCLENSAYGELFWGRSKGHGNWKIARLACPGSHSDPDNRFRDGAAKMQNPIKRNIFANKKASFSLYSSLHIAHLSGKRQQDRSFCAAKEYLFSIESFDKSRPLDFIQQAQIPEVFLRNALGLRRFLCY